MIRQDERSWNKGRADGTRGVPGPRASLVALMRHDSSQSLRTTKLSEP
jgi:hypothetical protein